MTVESDIATYLQTKGHGTLGSDLFIAFIRDSSLNQVVVFPTAGRAPHKVFDVRRPGFQIRVRNENYSTARTKIDSIRSELHSIVNTALSGTDYAYIYANQDPVYLGKVRVGNGETNEFSINFSTEIKD
jgi:hypothetical protein